MRNIFVRNYMSFAMLILVSFTFAGGVFIAQVSRYSMQEKKDQLETTVGYVKAILEKTPDVTDKLNAGFLETYLYQQASFTGATVMLADEDGHVVLAAVPQTEETENQPRVLGTVSEELVNTIKQSGSYFGLGNISGLFSENCFIAATSCQNEEGSTIALVIAATPSASINGMMRNIMRSYMFIVAITLILTLIVSWFLSDMLTHPLKGIVSAAKKFGHGDFDVRVAEDNDCDEIDELARSFNNMAASLQQQEELSRGFVANVSHELKTPMTSIRGFVDGMLDGTIPPERHNQYLHIISEEVGRLSRLVVRMLDAAKIQAGELIITPEPFDLTEMAARVLISFENQINDKQLEMDVDFADSVIVNGDSDHIYRVIYNLVDNAVKFVEPQGKLTLHLERDGNMSLFTIANTGAQIPADELPHVFDRFYKTDRSRSQDKTGAGLGLYIVKSIVNLHGGDISVRSANGETEFAFSMPLAVQAPQRFSQK